MALFAAIHQTSTLGRRAAAGFGGAHGVAGRQAAEECGLRALQLGGQPVTHEAVKPLTPQRATELAAEALARGGDLLRMLHEMRHEGRCIWHLGFREPFQFLHDLHGNGVRHEGIECGNFVHGATFSG